MDGQWTEAHDGEQRRQPPHARDTVAEHQGAARVSLQEVAQVVVLLVVAAHDGRLGQHSSRSYTVGHH